MLTALRRDAIRAFLSEKKSATVLEMAKEFSVTDETIRRDLSALEKEGFLTKVRGGAFIQGGTLNEIDINLRSSVSSNSKKLIAAKCQKIIKNGDSIFLDSSTTAYNIAEQIRDFRITVLTNSLKICDLLSAYPNIDLICIGGTFSKKNCAFFGSITNRVIFSYHVDKAFFSCRSASIEFGVMDSNEKSAELRRLVISQSLHSYLCIDHSKLEKTSINTICSFRELFAVVTDQPPAKNWSEFLASENVELIIASPSDA